MLEIKNKNSLLEIKNNKIIDNIFLEKTNKSNNYSYCELYINGNYIKTFPNYINNEIPSYISLNGNFLNINNIKENVIGIEGIFYNTFFTLNNNGYKKFIGYFFTPCKFKSPPTPLDFFDIIKSPTNDYIILNELDFVGDYRFVHILGYNLIFPKKVLNTQFYSGSEFYMLIDVYYVYDNQDNFTGVEILKEFPKSYTETKILDYFKEKYYYDESEVKNLRGVVSGGGVSNYYIVNHDSTDVLFFGIKNNLYEIELPKGKLNILDDFVIKKINKEDFNNLIYVYYYLDSSNFNIPVNITESISGFTTKYSNFNLFDLFNSLFKNKNIYFYISETNSLDDIEIKNNIYYIKKIDKSNFKFLTRYLNFYDIYDDGLSDYSLLEYDNKIYLYTKSNFNKNIIYPFSIKNKSVNYLFDLDEEEIFIYKDLCLCKIRDFIKYGDDRDNIKSVKILNPGNNYNNGSYTINKNGLKINIIVNDNKIYSVNIINPIILSGNITLNDSDFPNTMKNTPGGGLIEINVYDPFYKRNYTKYKNFFISTYLNIPGDVLKNNIVYGLIYDLVDKNNNFLKDSDIKKYYKFSGKIISKQSEFLNIVNNSISYMFRFIFQIK